MKRVDRTDEHERGAALILVAIMLTAMLAVAGLVLDGGFGYTNHRQMQNAADASALAAARTLQLVRFSAMPAQPGLDIESAARNQAQKNGSAIDDVSFDCRVLTLAQSRLDPPPAFGSLAECTTVTAVTAFNYVGVMVKAGESHTTFLGGFTNQSTQRTSGIAAATVQVGIGAGPWMVCGREDLSASAPGFDLIDPSTGVMRSDAAIAAMYGINADWPTVIAAGGHGTKLENINGTWAIALHGSQVSKDHGCGLSSNWKGLIDKNDLPITALPVTVSADNGNQVGHYKYEDTLARTDGCPSQAGSGTPSEGEAYHNCLLLIPIFDQIVSGNDVRLIDVAVFRVFYSQQGQPKYYAQFVCHTTCSLRGGATKDDLGGGGIPVVKLLV